MATNSVSAWVTTGLLLVAPAAVAGQGEAPPRTLDGRPDLQGVWDFRTVTPLERPEDLSDRAFLTEEEAAEIEAGATERRNRGLARSQVRTEPLPAGGGGAAVGGYNEFWFDRGTNVVGNQTSLIIDPPDGRPPVGRVQRVLSFDRGTNVVGNQPSLIIDPPDAAGDPRADGSG